MVAVLVVTVVVVNVDVDEDVDVLVDDVAGRNVISVGASWLKITAALSQPGPSCTDSGYAPSGAGTTPSELTSE